MAKNDVRFASMEGVSTRRYVVEDRVTSSASATIKAGEPVKVRGGETGNDLIILATGDPEIGTDIMVGIAANESDETATVDGTVDVYVPIAMKTVLRTFATTKSNVNTAAKRLALLNDTVTYDLTGSTFTVNENEGSDDNTHGLVIVDINTATGEIDYVIKAQAMQGGSKVGQTID